jgi:cobalamin-dependent methionine synthase I
MENKTYKFDFHDLHLKRSEIETVLGYKEDDDRLIVSDIIDELLNEAKNITDIKAQYSIFNNLKFQTESKTVSINKINFGVEKIVYNQLKKSESIAVFLCTAGPEIGIRSRYLMLEKDFLKGYIYDIIGSEIAEAAADLMQSDMEKNMREAGYKITNRYSPGYCGWNVADQHKLFQLIPENFCGINLTDSALMDPVKSISGFIGIGKDVKNNPYTCRMCSQDDCIYRRVREASIENA